METKHTPGPWRIGRHLGSPSEVRLIHKDVGDKGQGVPIIEGVVSIEDARLIAAAPELLDEARAFNAVVVTHECPSCGIAWSENECSQMLDEKSASCLCGYRHNFDGAASAKAEGR